MSEDTVPIEDFNSECIDSIEQSMGIENIHALDFEFECGHCSNPISLSFEISEYPTEVHNFTINNTTGAIALNEPEFQYLVEIYSSQDLPQSIRDLIMDIKKSPSLMREVTPREFEEVIYELFKSQGFEVDLTTRTRDGGKDIIAIHTDSMGIKCKYFIECKRYAEDNKIGVEFVRALHGVKNTMDGPNKTILVTTSSFTSAAINFAESEVSSKWDITLADYNHILKWLNDYN
ncbi:restriction endonuclease (plasmid) [Rahnella aceris]